MKINNNILLSLGAAALVAFGATSCASGSRGSAGGEVTGVGGTSWAEPTLSLIHI